ncbi:MAG TPA: hypothetical protein VK668_02590 [Mucilaginibacter sp.]|nr:hypothetical protein [Mucilaginibacter sp.]
MNDNRHSDLKGKLSKWLFAATLLLSLFTFPGLPYQSQTKYEAPKTTLVVNTKTSFAKSISYSRASAQNKLFSFAFKSLPRFEISRMHTRQVKTRITLFSRQSIVIKRSTFFYRAKAISRSAGDDPVISLG